MKKVKYYSRRLTKLLLLIILPATIIIGLTLMKYQPVYSVNFKGETIGLVGDKEVIEDKIDEFLTPQGSVAEAKLNEKPEYKVKLASKSEIETEEERVIEGIDSEVERKYRVYNFFVDGEKIGSLETQKDAEEIKKHIKDNKDFDKIEIKEEIKNNMEVESSEKIKLVAVEKVDKHIEKQEQETRRRQERERQQRLEAQRQNMVRRATSPIRYATGPAVGGAAGTAQRYVGSRYVYGGTGNGGFDCSGLTQHVYRQHGRSLPRTASAQAAATRRVPLSQAKPGDLLFWTNRAGGVYHVGIYTGGGTYVHASTPGTGVIRGTFGSFTPSFAGR